MKNESTINKANMAAARIATRLKSVMTYLYSFKSGVCWTGAEGISSLTFGVDRARLFFVMFFLFR